MRGPLAHRRVGTDDKVSALAHAGIPPHQCAKFGCRVDQYVRPATADAERPVFVRRYGGFGSTAGIGPIRPSGC